MNETRTRFQAPAPKFALNSTLFTAARKYRRRFTVVDKAVRERPETTGLITEMDPESGPRGLRCLIDCVIRAGSGPRWLQGPPESREWALLDTSGCDPGEYLIREWTDASGFSRPVERPPSRRWGGAIGLFTLQGGCISVGSLHPGVDEGAGLLLAGFASMLALPLPAHARTMFGANWLLVMSSLARDFHDAEVDRAFLLIWALLCQDPAGGAEILADSPESRSSQAADSRSRVCRFR